MKKVSSFTKKVPATLGSTKRGDTLYHPDTKETLTVLSDLSEQVYCINQEQLERIYFKKSLLKKEANNAN